MQDPFLETSTVVKRDHHSNVCHERRAMNLIEDVMDKGEGITENGDDGYCNGAKYV